MPQLPTRKLGKNGPQVVAQGFGTMGLSAFYGSTGTDDERFKVLDRAYELGQTNWDSADMYADSEDLIGKWFKRTGKRDHIFLATKFANKVGKDGSFSVDSSPEYAKAACAKSLQRLGIQTIDLYYCHRVDGKTPIEKTVEAMVQLKNEGKIRYIGLSEVSANTIRRAEKVHHIDAVQLEYSPFTMDIEQNDVLKTCRKLGIATVAYAPLGRGFLTGQYKSRDDFEADDFRRFAPRFSDENFPKNLVLVNQLAEIASRKGITPGQLALAWLAAQGDDIIAIPGTKKIKYLEENVEALRVQLSREEEREIRTAIEKVDVGGARYPDKMGGLTFGDTPEL
ncbi:putative aldo-keto reductase (AKR13) [Sclerotinia borealis F-4128]|uniref:Putative aldo-keto reductase (AKR13) n=1 Tax=Sclerotinia borealis (strain F-4128) TaxID=1432307 RepID=W9C8A9_SCLBF|nr:putative aldo-keto reductase (AKR13) [Sclerotinia borealis F-4128]